MAKVIVGMSGGVDSAVCAYLMKAAGYDVIGVTLRTWLSKDGKDSRCCEIDDAQVVAQALDIPYYVVNCIAEFKEKVTQPFIREYISGRTPNPCTGCNRNLKWGKLIETARNMQADFVATGHYANVVKLDNGRFTFRKADHIHKDQTYMLYELTQEQIASTLMPLGKLTKDEVREIAKSAGLPVAGKPDSQEICFVPEGSYAEYIEENAPDDVAGPGNFVDIDGNILGEHKGIIHYTVGQRKGLGIAMGYPIFVKEIRACSNEVVLAKENELYSNRVICEDVNLMSISALNEDTPCTVKVRYRDSGSKALISDNGDGRVLIRFDEPVRAAASGQAAVFYDDDDCLIGGGIIAEVSNG